MSFSHADAQHPERVIIIEEEEEGEGVSFYPFVCCW